MWMKTHQRNTSVLEYDLKTTRQYVINQSGNMSHGYGYMLLQAAPAQSYFT